LLHKKEIKKILGLTTQKGLTLIPTKIYFNKRGFLKVELALGKGKKIYDKRDDIKKRETQKQIDRLIRSHQKQR
jgi:SsrA-binding protein